MRRRTRWTAVALVVTTLATLGLAAAPARADHDDDCCRPSRRYYDPCDDHRYRYGRYDYGRYDRVYYDRYDCDPYSYRPPRRDYYRCGHCHRRFSSWIDLRIHVRRSSRCR